MRSVASVQTLTRNNSLSYTFQTLAVRLLTLFCLLALAATGAYAQSSAGTGAIYPVFPKYQVMSVVYAPPGSASSVTYSTSTGVGSTNTQTSFTSSSSTDTTGFTVGVGLFGWGGSITQSWTDGWTTGAGTSASVQVSTTSGNSVATMGPISSALGVNHDNDVIYIWLNPLEVYKQDTTPGDLHWTFLASNGCDASDTGDPLTFYQNIYGCDPNQFPFPDIVGIPVWCLKNPYFPAQSCAQWLPYTSRSWDKTLWPNDPVTLLPTGPGLTLADYADILSADPFVTQTIVPPSAGICQQPPSGIATPLSPYCLPLNSQCHPTYGVNLTPTTLKPSP